MGKQTVSGKRQQELDDSFSAGVCSALSLVNAHRHDTALREIVEQNGKCEIIRFAMRDGRLESTGISRVFGGDQDYQAIVNRK